MRSKQAKIVVALGSNAQAEHHVLLAKGMLEATFDNMVFSTPLWTDPIGMASGKFLNLLGVGYSRVSKDRTLLAIKNIERKCGRRVAETRKGVISIDIDLLLFDSERLHEADWERDYIKTLFRQLGEPMD